jgi:excisionase family DNA binding protein
VTAELGKRTGLAMHGAAQIPANGAAPSTHRALTLPTTLLTLQDCAKVCACSVWTVRGWVDAGKLPVLRLGRLVRVRPADLEAFLSRCAG